MDFNSEEGKKIKEALNCAEMWIGKMIADNGHLNSVAPDHCVNTLRLIEQVLNENNIRHIK